MKNNGFTLLEIIVVMVILSLFFSSLIGSYIFIVNKSLKTIKSSQNLYSYTKSIYLLKNSVACAKDIKIDNSQEYPKLYLYTYCGVYKGFSKEVFFVKDHHLYLYAYPYKFGSLYFYDKTKATKLIPIKIFKAKFLSKSMISIYIDQNRFNIPLLGTYSVK